MSDLQELTRCQSLPVLNREEAVIQKMQEQDGIISLMQTQIEFQSEALAKHDKLFIELQSKVQDLTAKLLDLEETLSKRAQSTEAEAERLAVWSMKEVPESKSSIADIVKETAEQTLGAESTFVYNEELGLYFDQASGYYYDPIKQLYYNGHTKTYYSYDQATNTYQAYGTDSIKRKKKSKTPSRKSTRQKVTEETPPEVEAKTIHRENDDYHEPESPTIEEAKVEERKERRNFLPSPHASVKTCSDMEEGEISSSAPTSAESSPRSASNDSCDDADDHQVSYPPCIRAVIQSSSDTSQFKKGTLFVIPCTGGTVGSHGSQHVVLLPVASVDKVHAKIHYDDAKANDETELESGNGKYFITDMGSTEGTYLNNQRLSDSGISSAPHEIAHGSTLQIGDVTLLLHIHPGDFTCGHCEPGLILQKDPMYEYTPGESSDTVRKAEMKKIKKKYGIDRKNENINRFNSEVAYTDRAKSRRLKIGSDNPYAKTEVASTDAPIGESNKGFKMLKKMGWKGEGLGNSANEGIKEPIKCDVKTNRGGLGLDTSQLPTMDTHPKRGKSKQLKHLAKTIERFNQASQLSPRPMDDLDM